MLPETQEAIENYLGVKTYNEAMAELATWKLQEILEMLDEMYPEYNNNLLADAVYYLSRK